MALTPVWRFGKYFGDAEVTAGGVDVTLAGTPDYITIVGQVITRALIDLANHITGRLPYANLVAATAASRLIGRRSGSAGDFEEVSLGANLSMSAGGVLSASGGGGSATVVEVDLGSTPTFQGKFTITDAAITSSSKVFVSQSYGPYTGKGTQPDEGCMDPITCLAIPATGTAQVCWRTTGGVRPVSVFSGGAKGRSATSIYDALQNAVPTQMVPLGMVKGNVKFAYQVFA